MQAYVPPQVPLSGHKVVYIDDYRPDPAFKARVAELLGNMTDQVAADRTGLHRNHIRDLREGRAKSPTYNMLRKLAGLREWATITWLAEGHDESEESIDTIEQLHAWDMRITKQRLRYFEAILAQQQAMVAGTTPLSAGDDAALQALSEGLVAQQRTARGQAPGGPRPAAAPRDGESRPKS